jgi:hypothetical protein
MAHHRLGHKDEARTWLAKASDFVAELRKGKPPADGTGGHVFDWKLKLEAGLFFGEARRLIDGKEPRSRAGAGKRRLWPAYLVHSMKATGGQARKAAQ